MGITPTRVSEWLCRLSPFPGLNDLSFSEPVSSSVKCRLRELNKTEYLSQSLTHRKCCFIPADEEGRSDHGAQRLLLGTEAPAVP